jgi:nucleotide-binding universal stress UspA family protein
MFSKILYPTDFSDVAKKALPYVELLRNAGAREVVVVHVIDSRSLDLLCYDPGNHRTIEKNLKELALENSSFIKKHMEKSGLSVKVIIKTGNPASQILKVEKEEQASVIVIGSHGKSNIEEMIIGSVSERVVRNASCPVLVIKR